MCQKKGFKHDEQSQRQNPPKKEPYIQHGNFEKRDIPQNDRYKPSFDPKPGDTK